MKKILNKLFEQQQLSKAEAKEVLIQMANEKYNASQMASFLTVYLMRPISVKELAGFREALLELAVKIDLSESIINKKDSVNKEIDTVFVELETIKKVYEKNHNVILNNNTGEDYIFFTEYLRKYSERLDSLDNIRAIKKD